MMVLRGNFLTYGDNGFWQIYRITAGDYDCAYVTGVTGDTIKCADGFRKGPPREAMTVGQMCEACDRLGTATIRLDIFGRNGRALDSSLFKAAGAEIFSSGTQNAVQAVKIDGFAESGKVIVKVEDALIENAPIFKGWRDIAFGAGNVEETAGGDALMDNYRQALFDAFCDDSALNDEVTRLAKETRSWNWYPISDIEEIERQMPGSIKFDWTWWDKDPSDHRIYADQVEFVLGKLREKYLQ